MSCPCRVMGEKKDCYCLVDDKRVGRPSYISEDNAPSAAFPFTWDPSVPPLTPYAHEWRAVGDYPTPHWRCVNCGLDMLMGPMKTVTVNAL